MPHKPSIKILVSCHKPVCVPSCDAYLPVHVGSLGKPGIKGYQRDDQGENISDRNFTFCEMSGQYWAWKNLNADYIGQCHYRRYFTFDDGSHEANDHGQIEVDCLSSHSLASYGIDDESRIRAALDDVDLLRAPYWSVKGVPTPTGPKKTVRDHMVAYGLVTQGEFDRLIELCHEIHPEYEGDLISYLDGSDYLGYNCFIMRSQLFDRLCDFEFSILRRFDDEYDYANKTITHRRICGYLGEVLYSTFVNHVTKEGVKIAERPMVFFEATPAPYELNSTVETETCNIVWRYEEVSPARLAIALMSLIRSLGHNSRYKLVLVHNAALDMAQLRRYLGNLPDNFEFLDLAFPSVPLGEYEGRIDEVESNILLPFILPSVLFGEGSKIMWVEGCALFRRDPIEVFADSSVPVSAARSVFLEKELNKPLLSDLSFRVYEDCGGFPALETSCIVFDYSQLGALDIDLYREYCSFCTRLQLDPRGDLEVERSKYKLHKRKPGTSKDMFCMPISVYAVRSCLLHAFGAEQLSVSSVMPLVGETELRTWANEETVREFSDSGKSAIFLYHPDATPFANPENAESFEYWKLARETSAYEPLIMTLTEYRPLGLRQMLLPEGTRRYRFVRAIVTGLRSIV